MIAVDTSSFIDFLKGKPTSDARQVERAMSARTLWLPPPVKTELLSVQVADRGLEAFIRGAPLLPIADGFWERAGENRRLILSKGLKARLADTLIAQCCIDARISLIATDEDYRHFVRWCGLTLVE